MCGVVCDGEVDVLCGMDDCGVYVDDFVVSVDKWVVGVVGVECGVGLDDVVD